MFKKRLCTALAIGLVASGCMMLSGCIEKPVQPIAEQKLEQVKVVLDYTPNTNHTGLYVALAHEYFKEEGLDVIIEQPGEDGADALVAQGSADFGVSYQDIMANYLGSKNPLPVVAIGAILQHNTSGIMSAKSSDITRPKDMQNHSYATWNIPVEQAILKTVVTKDGADFSKVEMVPYNTFDEVQALEQRDFDSVWVYEGWACQNAKLKNFAYNYFAFKDTDPVFDYYTPVLITSQNVLDTRSDVAQKFMRAVKKGYEFAAKNPEQAGTILCEQVPELDKDLVALSQKFLSPLYLDDNGVWGTIDEVRWNNFYTWMNSEKLTEETLGYNAGLNTSLCNQ